MEINSLVASFLGGTMTSGLVFMFAFMSRLTKLEATLSHLCTTVKEMKDGRTVCIYHGKTIDKLNSIDKELGSLKERVGDG